MSVKQVEYHQGAIGDVKSAVAWYRERSSNAALNFIEELDSAARCHSEERSPRERNDEESAVPSGGESRFLAPRE